MSAFISTFMTGHEAKRHEQEQKLPSRTRIDGFYAHLDLKKKEKLVK
jgi:hypothetical protein